MGRPVPAFASSSASSNLSPQLLLLFLLSASSTLTNFSIEEIPQAGPDPGVPEPPRCLTAPARRASEQTSRQEVAIPAAGQPWGRGAGRQGGSPGSGGGAVPVQGSEQGAAALRAGGFQLRKDPGGLGTARSQVIRGPKCQSWGLRTGGFRDALCTGPPPPPPSSTLGSLGWDQAFSNQSAAAVEPEPGAVNQARDGWGWGEWGRLGWLLASFSPPYPQQPPPSACRKVASAFATVKGGVPNEADIRLRLVSLTSPYSFPVVASEAPPLAEGLKAVAKRHYTPNAGSAHAEGGASLYFL